MKSYLEERAGSMIHRMIGDGLEGWSIASVMVIVSFGAMLYAEYERETD